MFKDIKSETGLPCISDFSERIERTFGDAAMWYPAKTAEDKINSRVDEWVKHVQRSRDASYKNERDV